MYPKMAGFAGRQAAVVAGNIRALLDGSELARCESMPEVILITIGPDGGAAQLPGQDDIAGADVATARKSADLMVDRYAALFAGQ
jgi:NADH dehydrogenase FAD-containing subunit